MFARVLSSALWGISSKLVQVEVDVNRGLPSFCIVGLPDAAVKESRDRVISAFKNSELDLPPKKITVNLAPAHLRKEGPAYDLPIALGLLSAFGQLPFQQMENHLIFGELSLDGNICPVRGALAMVDAARKNGISKIILPTANAEEVGVFEDCSILPVGHLLEAVHYFTQKKEIEPFKVDLDKLFNQTNPYTVDYAEVRGQQHAKRAMEVAAAGGHNLLMIGPPGSGKTMLTHRLPTILPELTLHEALETTSIYSVSGQMKTKLPLMTERPFRSPHHTVSDVALIGGGAYPRPGEVSLAHNGVLFLDELPEFSKNALEVLRQPLEDGQVTISRTAAAVNYPCRFMLIGAMNPCPCGFYTDPTKECTCSSHQIQKYLGKISGPLLDRFDIHLEVPAVKFKELSGQDEPESSIALRERVKQARERQTKRFSHAQRVAVNAHLGPRFIRKYCQLDSACHDLLKQAIERLGLSARAYHRILKVSRSIADLDDQATIQIQHVSEAIQYRALDKRYWRQPQL